LNVITQPPQSAPLAPLDLQQTKHAMELYQQGVHSLLADDDWQTFQSKGETHRFLKRSGWRKIALWFNLSLETVSIHIDRDKTDRPLRARVIARATAPNGRYCDGEGGASPSDTFGQKPEHDLAATASTRATNRAISNLVGLGAVSAEELDEATPISAATPYGQSVGEGGEDEAAKIVQKLHPSIDGFALIGVFKQTLGVDTLPEASLRILKAVAWGASDGNPKISGNAKE
jgi:hypothetical protein